MFGALIGVGAMFALRQWGQGFTPDLTFVGAGGPAPVGELPAASLPIIAGVLGALFGLDNTESPKEAAALPPRRRVSAGDAGDKRAKATPRGVAEVDDADEVEVVSKRAKR